MSVDPERPEVPITRTVTLDQFMSRHGYTGGIELTTPTATATAYSARDTMRSERYDIGDEIARGGMGSVLLARDHNIRRQVAMKVMLHVDDADVQLEGVQQAMLRFIEEAQITAQLDHPNIVPVHELGVDQSNDLFYTMTYVKGRTLQEILSDIRKFRTPVIQQFPLSRLLTVYQKVCDAIAFAHSRGVIHRDLKPSNIMVGDYGEVQVMDWGIAKVMGRERPDDQAAATDAPAADWRDADLRTLRIEDNVLKTLDGKVLGTPAYMAPEQALGETDQVDTRADIYALGAILYTILTLHPPIAEGDTQLMLSRVTAGEITDPTEYARSKGMTGRELVHARDVTLLVHCPDSELPEPLAAVALKAMGRSPADRYQTVTEVQQEVEAYQHGFATQAESASMSRQLWLLAKRNTTAMAVAAVAILIAAGMLAWFSGQLKEREALYLEKKAEAEQAYANMLEEQEKKETLARNSVPQLMRLARRSMRDGEFATARARASQVLRLNDQLPEPWAMLGLLALGEQDHAAAEQALRRVEALDPEGMAPDLPAYFRLVEAGRSMPPAARLGQSNRQSLKRQFAALPPLAGYHPMLYHYRVPDLGIRLVRVPAGSFPRTTADKSGKDSAPLQVDAPYWLALLETSRQQFRVFVEAQSYVTTAEKIGGAMAFGGAGDGLQAELTWRSDGDSGGEPVACVSLADAHAFCEWLTARERQAGRLPDGQVYRLPTESEWEVACRAGLAGDLGYDGTAAHLPQYAHCNPGAPAAPPRVGSRRPNAWGFHDLLGSVWEWCTPDDPTAALTICRGGGWETMAVDCTAASRRTGAPLRPSNTIGFRIVLGEAR
jgi:serine/threonine protein kinase/formylglycine-generating enzyme required for sulfatase activity